MEGHVLSGGDNVEFVGTRGGPQGVEVRAGVFDHAQGVVVGGVGVGPLLDHRGDGVAEGAAGVELVTHAQQILSGCTHSRAFSGANIGVQHRNFSADSLVFRFQSGERFHGDAQFGSRTLCYEVFELQIRKFFCCVFAGVKMYRRGEVDVVVERYVLVEGRGGSAGSGGNSASSAGSGGASSGVGMSSKSTPRRACKRWVTASTV